MTSPKSQPWSLEAYSQGGHLSWLGFAVLALKWSAWRSCPALEVMLLSMGTLRFHMTGGKLASWVLG